MDSEETKNYREVVISQNRIALVSEEDYPAIAAVPWFYALGYARRNAPRQHYTRGPQIQMHRVIIGAKEGEEVDHINGNTLDNRRENLRICTHAENVRNRIKRTHTSSIYKGVHRRSDTGKWRAAIAVDARTVHLGTYTTEVEAAMAYNTAALHYHGRFARLNHIPDDDLPTDAPGQEYDTPDRGPSGPPPDEE